MTREQFIVNVVGVVVPNCAESALGLGEPGGALGMVLEGFYRQADVGVLGQSEGLQQPEGPALVNRFDCGGHSKGEYLWLFWCAMDKRARARVKWRGARPGRLHVEHNVSHARIFR